MESKTYIGAVEIDLDKLNNPLATIIGAVNQFFPPRDQINIGQRRAFRLTGIRPDITLEKEIQMKEIIRKQFEKNGKLLYFRREDGSEIPDRLPSDDLQKPAAQTDPSEGYQASSGRADTNPSS